MFFRTGHPSPFTRHSPTQLTHPERSLWAGESGPAAHRAMQILETLGRIYDAERMIPVSSVQISGVSYDNLGDAGLLTL